MGAGGTIHVAGDLVDVANQIRAAGGLLSTTDGGTMDGVKLAPAKPGWKTTEFWLTVLTGVGAVAAAEQGNLPDRYAAVAAAVSVAAYAIARSIAKH